MVRENIGLDPTISNIKLIYQCLIKHTLTCSAHQSTLSNASICAHSVTAADVFRQRVY